MGVREHRGACVHACVCACVRASVLACGAGRLAAAPAHVAVREGARGGRHTHERTLLGGLVSQALRLLGVELAPQLLQLHLLQATRGGGRGQNGHCEPMHRMHSRECHRAPLCTAARRRARSTHLLLLLAPLRRLEGGEVLRVLPVCLLAGGRVLLLLQRTQAGVESVSTSQRCTT